MKYEVIKIPSFFTNAYLIKGKRIALIDTLAPFSLSRLCSSLSRNGIGIGDIEFVLLTHHHFDHAGCAAYIRRLSGAYVIAGFEDAPFIEGEIETPLPSQINRLGRVLGKLPPALVRKVQSYERVKVDYRVRDGERIDELGFEVLSLPGHTPGGVAYMDRDARIAFIGDMVSSFFGRLGMPSLSASTSLDDIIASQEKLASLDMDIFYPGHGDIIAPSASNTVGEFVARRKSKLS